MLAINRKQFTAGRFTGDNSPQADSLQGLFTAGAIHRRPTHHTAIHRKAIHRKKNYS